MIYLFYFCSLIIPDLKTLIANDIQQQEKQKTFLTSKNTGPERLYSCPTISSKSKTTKQPQSKVNEPKPQSSGNNFKHKPQSRSKNKENEMLSKEPLREKKLEIINSEPVTSTKHYRKLKSSKNC